MTRWLSLPSGHPGLAGAIPPPATSYCEQGSAGGIQFVQHGTSGCLYIDTSNRTITEGNCASEYADWNITDINSGTYAGCDAF
jgi:hypothetical protein